MRKGPPSKEAEKEKSHHNRPVSPFRMRGLIAAPAKKQSRRDHRSVPPFQLRWPIAGFPHAEKIKSDPAQMYSDHLPQLFKIVIRDVEINLMTYNIYAQAGACGYTGYERLEGEELRTPTPKKSAASGAAVSYPLYQARLKRIAASIKNMVAQHRIHAVAIQEGISPEFAEFFKNEIGNFSFRVAYKNGQWFLYDPSFFRLVTNLISSKKYNTNIFSDIQRLCLVTDSGYRIIFNNVHMEHKELPHLHQAWLKEVHAEKGVVITIGDFNSGITPFQLSGRIPGKFIEGQEAYDSTDGCVVSTPESPASFVPGKVIDPRTGNIIKASTRFPMQPIARRYRACISLNETSNLLRDVAQVEPNIRDIVAVYDVQSGKAMSAFLLKANSPLFSLLSEIGLMQRCNFIDSSDGANLRAYVVSNPSNFSTNEHLSGLLGQFITQQTAALNAGKSDLSLNIGILKGLNLKNPTKLCQLAQVLKVMMDPSLSVPVKQKKLDEYRGQKSFFSSFSSSPEEKAREEFVMLAKQFINSKQEQENDIQYWLRDVRI